MAIPTADKLREIGRLREGRLETVPFSVLLHALALRGRTATLSVERNQMRKTILLDGGVPVDCRSNLVHETLGRFMVAAGRLSAEDDKACLMEALRRGVPEGQVLMERQLVGGVELFRILQQHLAKKLLDLFTWREGRFRVGFEVPEVDSTLKIRVPQLVVMGITKYAAQEEVNAAVAPLVGKVLTLHPRPPFPIEEIRLSARHGAILEPLQRRCRMDELAVATRLDPNEMSRLLYALTVLGVVAPADEVPELPEEPAAAPTARAPSARPGTAPAEAERPAVATVDHARLSNEVMQAYLSYRRKDAYDMLEVAEDAPPRAIEERYLELAERFAPGRFVGQDLAPIAEKARDVFLGLARAYGELADPELRGILTGRRRTLREEAGRGPRPTSPSRPICSTPTCSTGRAWPSRRRATRAKPSSSSSSPATATLATATTAPSSRERASRCTRASPTVRWASSTRRCASIPARDWPPSTPARSTRAWATWRRRRRTTAGPSSPCPPTAAPSRPSRTFPRDEAEDGRDQRRRGRFFTYRSTRPIRRNSGSAKRAAPTAKVACPGPMSSAPSWLRNGSSLMR